MFVILYTARSCGLNTTARRNLLNDPNLVELNPSFQRVIEQLNKTFDHRIRLGIMSALMVNEEVSFNFLKELLGVTDGNLASHIKPLEEAKFIKINKSFIGKKPNTTYSITKSGEKQFRSHLDALEAMIHQAKQR